MKPGFSRLFRARLLPLNPVLTPTLQERGRTGRTRRCATPDCGIKHERHFRHARRGYYHPTCDVCRGVAPARAA